MIYLYVIHPPHLPIAYEVTASDRSDLQPSYLSARSSNGISPRSRYSATCRNPVTRRDVTVSFRTQEIAWSCFERGKHFFRHVSRMPVSFTPVDSAQISNLVNADFKASLTGSRQASLGTVIRAGPDEQPERLGGRSAEVLIVARLARVLAVGVRHHVTQRGNARRFILDCDADRMVYLNLHTRTLSSTGWR
jgi:hypothetical protein